MPYKNKEEGKRNKHEYYLKNKDRINAKSKEKRKLITNEERNRERLLSKERYWKNKVKNPNWSKYRSYINTFTKEELMEYKEKIREKSKIYYEENKERIRNKQKENNIKNSLSKYGINIEIYNKMLEDQNGVCAICKKIDNTAHIKTLPLVVDHSHKLNIVRELLCVKCNLLIGFAIEDTKILKSAIHYLEKWK